MAGGIQIGADGVSVHADGVVVGDADDTPCCCEEEGGCGDCDGIDDISVTLADIIKCTCVDMGGYRDSLIDDPNGVYTGFTKTTGGGYDCIFTKTITLTVRTYSDAGCTMLTGTTTDCSLIVRHKTATNTWETVLIGVDDNLTSFFVFAAHVVDGFDNGIINDSYDFAGVCGNSTDPYWGNDTGLGKEGTVEIEFICV